MNLSKTFEFFNPDECKEWCHVIGNGSVGSCVAELLTRFGIKRIKLYDMDTVEPHNVANQMFTSKHIGMPKVEAVKQIILDINPDIEEIAIEPNGWNGQPLDGYVFLCVDNIDTRRKIVEENIYNTFVKAMFDFRTGLTDGQHFAGDWSDLKLRKAFKDTMNFTHEEAKLTQQRSACNVELCVAPTVRLVSNVGVANFINFAKGEHLYKQILVDAFSFLIEPIG